MDYSGFHDFPFPSNLSEEDRRLKNYFFTLSDDDQLKLLNGSRSYEEFHNRVEHRMGGSNISAR
ncbi:MAG TPA: hypothetical protein VHO71_00910 [Caproiciproducens sp.]|nr:hypothetical protein [Caproiciproducens sp.]